MVAPTSKNVHSEDPRASHSPTGGAFHKLPRPGDAPYEMAPSLCHAIRGVLEGKQVPAQSFDLYVNKIRQNERYNRAFKTLWALGKWEGVDFERLP